MYRMSSGGHTTFRSAQLDATRDNVQLASVNDDVHVLVQHQTIRKAEQRSGEALGEA